MARRGPITAAFTIREYQDRDETQLVGLIRELQAFEFPLYRWGKQPEDIGPWYVQVAKEQCAKYEGSILVAEAENLLLGYATIMTKCEDDENDDEIAYTYAQIYDLVVTRSARRKGIGNALMQACEDKARSAGRKIFRIGVLAQNTGAIAAYQNFCFAPYH